MMEKVMKFSRFIFKVVTILLACLSSAVVYSTEMREPGNLSITVHVGDSPKLVADWIATNPETEGRNKTFTSIKQPKKLYAAFIVSGYTRDDDDETNFSVDVQLIGPDGKTLIDKREWSKNNSRIPSARGLILAGPLFPLTFTESARKGVYWVRATVKDKLSDTSVKNFYYFEFK